MIVLKEKFRQDTLGANLNIIPMVVIDDSIYISQVKQNFGGRYWQDLDLKINSIKESVDFESHKFKISNVSITLNNYVINKQRFSDRNYINKDVSIYWKSQSCESLDDCLFVYKGIVRKLDHNTETVTLELEDLTEQRFHRDLPQTLLPSNEGVLEKYRNKPVPIVYGSVDKSPLVFSDLYSTLIPDTKDIDTFVTEDNSFGLVSDPLLFHVGHYVNIVKNNQYLVGSKEIIILSSKLSNISTDPEEIDVGETEFLCHDSSKTFQVTLSNILEDEEATTEDYDSPPGSVSKIFDGSQDNNEIHWTEERTRTAHENITSTVHKNDIILLYDSNDGYLNFDFRAIYSGNNENREFLLLQLGFRFLPNYDFVHIDDTHKVKLKGMTFNGVNFSSILPYVNDGNPTYGYVIQTNSDSSGTHRVDIDYITDAIGGIGYNGGLYSDYHSFGQLVAYGAGHDDPLDSPEYAEWAMINAQINFKNTYWDDAAPSNWDAEGNNPDAPLQFESSIITSGENITVTATLKGHLNEIGLFMHDPLAAFLSAGGGGQLPRSPLVAYRPFVNIKKSADFALVFRWTINF